MSIPHTAEPSNIEQEVKAFADLSVERLTSSWLSLNLPMEALAHAMLNQGLALTHTASGPGYLISYLGHCVRRMPTAEQVYGAVDARRPQA